MQTACMARNRPELPSQDRAPDSGRDGPQVVDELPLELAILDEELLWLSGLLPSLMDSETNQSEEKECE